MDPFSLIMTMNGIASDYLKMPIIKAIENGTLAKSLATKGILAKFTIAGYAGDIITISVAYKSGDGEKFGEAVTSSLLGLIGATACGAVGGRFFPPAAPIIAGVGGAIMSSYGSDTWNLLSQGEKMQLMGALGLKIESAGSFGFSFDSSGQMNWEHRPIKPFTLTNDSWNYATPIEQQNRAGGGSIAPVVISQNRIDPNSYYITVELVAGDGWAALEARYGSSVRSLPEYNQSLPPGTKLNISLSGDQVKSLVAGDKLRGGDAIYSVVGQQGDLQGTYSDMAALLPEGITSKILEIVNGKDAYSLKVGDKIAIYQEPINTTNQFEFHVDPLAGIKKTDVTDPNYWNGSLLNGGGYNGTANFEVNKDIFDANGKLSNYVNNLMAGNITGGVRPGNVNPSENFFGINYEITGNINSSSQQGKNISYVDPLILDLNGDGVKTTDYGSSPVFFDADNDGSLEQTGWVSAQDGIVVKDLNNNGIIDNISETMSEYFGGVAGTDGGTKPFKDGFAALKSLDSNGDNVFDNKDTDWGKVKVWVDANHDGKTDAGELKSFEELNIKQINLANQAQSGEVRDGNEVLARGTYLTTDGKLQEALAANFLANPNGHKFTQSGTGTIVDTQGSGTIAAVKAYVAGDGGETVDVAVKGVNNATGGKGNDILIGDATSNWLAGGTGSDIFNAGAGDDVLLIDAEDKQENIRGGAGMDTVIAIGDKGVTLNMSNAEVEIFQGNRGDDVIVGGGSSSVFIAGGDGNDILIGGAANDAINGENDNDMIDGGAGNDILRGGRGRDTVYGGKGDDYIDGGQDDDALYGGAGNDVLRGAAGDDVIDGGDGTDILELSGNLSEYRIMRTATGIWISDTVAGRDGTDFVKNVEKANFKDVSLVDIPSNTSEGLENPLLVKDIIKTDKDGKSFDHTTAHYISQAQLLQNDIDWQNDKLTITEVSDAVGGTVRLTEAGDILFTPDAGYSGIMSFKYTVKDSKGNDAAWVINNAGDSAKMRAAVYLKTPELPVDPLVTDQWYLNDANILPVWKDYTGKGVRIGQFEPGGSYATTKEIFDYRHYDLKNNVDADWLAGNTAGNIAGEGAAGKFSNHATLVAGVMVAENNGQGGVGVAYDAKIGGHFIDQSSNDALNASLSKMKNYDVVNNSWGVNPNFNGTFTPTGTIAKAYLDAANEGRGGLGSVIVMAGGNDREKGGNANYTNAANNRVSIAVGAVNANADLSTLQVGDKPFSNPGANLLVSAPGSNITSTSRMITTDDGSTFGADNSVSQGTSFAAPIISGIVALMLQANPKLGYRDVQEILAISAKQIADTAKFTSDWKYNSADNWNGGGMHASHDYGFGMVDARAAVRLAETWTAQQTLANEVHMFSEAKNVNAAITDGNANGITSSVIEAVGDMRIEHVEVRVNLTHERPGDLIIKLIGPNGTESILMNRPGVSATNPTGDATFNGSNNLDFVFTTTHDWGENPAGEWKLVVIDTVTGKTGTLNNWSINAYGKLGALTNDQYYYTDEYATLAGVAGHNTILNDTDGGTDTINVAALSTGAIVNISSGAATIAGKGLTIQNPGTIENIVAGEGNDTLVGNAVNNVLAGGRGNDTLSGEAGNDALFGGKGNNILIGGTDNDSFIIERNEGCCDTVADFAIGADRLVLSGFDSATLATMTVAQTGADTKLAFANGQSILLKNINATSFGTTLANNLNICVVSEGVSVKDFLNAQLWGFGSEGADLLSLQNLNAGVTYWAGGGSNIVLGSNYNDILFGGAGADYIDGGKGNDIIYLEGDNMQNVIVYNNGANRANAQVLGGEGADRFVLSQLNQGGAMLDNVISDFNAGQGDVIDLSQIPGATDFSQLNFTSLNYNGMQFTVVSVKDDPLHRCVTLYNVKREGLSAQQFIFRPGNTPGLTNVTGTAGNDTLVGDAGGNTLDGGLGADSMEGRTGDDTYYVDNVGDKVIEQADGGYDTVKSTISLTLADNVEQLELLGTANINATGNALSNRIIGNDGDNIIDGGAGIDTMLGGKGNDTYIIDNGFDRVFEADNEGIDTVQASMSYTLGANFENLTLTGTDAINATGNELNNILIGNDGDNKLDGQTGADTMQGGKGNDIYFVDNAGDKVVENVNEGNDTVYSSVDYTLTANVENLILGNNAKNATGNELDNQLVGNGQDNILTGGKGRDYLIGGTGNDTYVFNIGDGQDYISESNNAGEDKILFGAGIAKTDLEFYKTDSGDLVIKRKDSTDSITVQKYFTDTAIERIMFADGTSIDKNYVNDNIGTKNIMRGGAGDDEFEVFSASDVVIEEANSGIDSVWSSIDYTLGANVENLQLVWDGDINGTGNELDNRIYGNSGNNILNGGKGDDILLGQEGNDTLFGGDGNDRIEGGIGNDVIDGGSGSDWLYGGKGSDVILGGDGDDSYMFVAGDGQDTIGDSAGNDTATFSNSTDLRLMIAKINDDLVLSTAGTSDQVTVKDWYKGDSNKIETIKSGNGKQLLAAQIDNLIQVMAQLQAEKGMSWNDLIQSKPNEIQTVLNQFWTTNK